MIRIVQESLERTLLEYDIVIRKDDAVYVRIYESEGQYPPRAVEVPYWQLEQLCAFARAVAITKGSVNEA